MLGFPFIEFRESSGFYRLEVSQAGDVTEVDFGADFRLLPIEQGPLGPTLAGEELAINKVLAVFGRAEARDFVDLSALTKRYGLEHLMRRGSEKDPGFDAQVFAEMLTKFERLPRGRISRSPTRITRGLFERLNIGGGSSSTSRPITFRTRGGLKEETIWDLGSEALVRHRKKRGAVSSRRG